MNTNSTFTVLALNQEKAVDIIDHLFSITYFYLNAHCNKRPTSIIEGFAYTFAAHTSISILISGNPNSEIYPIVIAGYPLPNKSSHSAYK